MNDTQILLLAARTLIADPQAWVQGCTALDKYDNGVRPDNIEAVKWCGLGAVEFVGLGDNNEHLIYNANVYLEQQVGMSFVDFNDDIKTTHGKVLRAFDKAIVAAAGNLL